MVRIEDVDVREDLIERTVELSAALPAGETAVVFPGRRAVSHFALSFARLQGGPCRPPALLTVEALARKAAGLPAEGPEPLESLRLLRRAVLAAGGPALLPVAADLVTFLGPGSAFLEVLETLEEEEVSDGDLAALRSHPAFDDLALWARGFHEALPALRSAYRDLCATERAWTPAQALRRAAVAIEEGRGHPWRHLLFCGFFSLTRAQVRLVNALGRSAEVTLLRHHDGRSWEAFRRMEAELEPDHPPPPFSPPLPDLSVEAAPSAHAEALRVAEILSEEATKPGETVVVLPDPGTLLPLLWDGLGVVEGEFNVTLGYPLARSPLFTLLEAVLRAAEEGGGEAVSREAYLRLLFHPYVKNYAPEGLEPGSLRIFFHAVETFLRKKEQGRVDLGALEAEEEPRKQARRMNPDGPGEEVLSGALREVHDLFFRQIRSAADLEELAASLERLLGRTADRSPAPLHPFYRPSFQAASRCLATLREVARREGGCAAERRRLPGFVRERLREVRVPFTGLPVRGLQVMGVLETQTLRFPSVILLDADTDVLPTSPPPDPLLPPAFRKALGLPGVLERAEIYRYHVFRLLESSRRAWALHTDTSGKSRSPFIEQLLWEARRAGEERRVVKLAFRGGGKREPLSAVPKSPELLDRLKALEFSPSSLDAYLTCPLRFYWGYALSLREREEGEETDSRRVGILLHRLMRDLFRPYVDRALSRDAFEEMEARLPERAAEAFAGLDAGFLLAALAERRLGDVLRRERARCPAGTVLLGVEEKMALDLEGAGDGPVRVSGTVDRLDRLPDGSVRITDYKSGKELKTSHLPKRNLPDVQADRRELKKGLQSLQLPLYVELVRKNRDLPPGGVEARLLSLRKPDEEPAALGGSEGDLEALLEGFILPVVRRLVGEILDPDLPFEGAPAEPDSCRDCSYAALCRRPLPARGVY